MKADFGGGRLRRGRGRVEDLHNTLVKLDDSGFVNIQTSFEFLLQSRQLASQFASVREHRAHLNERPHNKDAHVRRTGAVEHVGGHDRTMLGEGVGKVFDILAPLQGHKL
jgi:hypothetical protein